ncbi:hypothetical protein NA57DRAFT_65223 [Rhizodiscina lignyota]|uniref:Zn(2)-C6 fungal-type domain-containing protein n=1 Tax=Rhizodiscina lignyota TaxID=1504668 RepID=A0A9P4MB03_9PEZI|nr:hypothetical protein NA57DRAFT_65223 [Rhizodiscina lignyota]
MQNGVQSKACENCHRRKIRCDMHTGSFPCANCRTLNQDCRPHQRKRKNAPVEPPSARPEKRLSVDLSSDSPAVGEQLPNASETISLQRSAVSSGNAVSPGSYLGRAEYVSGTVPIDEEDAKNYSAGKETVLPETDQKFLADLRAFEIPPRSVRESLLSNFMERCHPWMPIVELVELRPTKEFEPSVLLLQAVFVAGSRVSMAPQAQASGHSFYRRAKALYYTGCEKDPLATVRAIVMLQWWNPSGPEHISMDASSFWLHMGVALAHQIGLHREPNPKLADAALRRRLWWTLVTRDCMISMSHGRPRAINNEDCDVRPLSIEDFDEPNFDARLFIAYVEACTILGDLTEGVLRGNLGHARRLSLQSRLYSWIRDLPDELRVYKRNGGGLMPYNHKARQLHTLYFTALTLLFRPAVPENAPSGAALLASSFTAGVYEDFLARGEVPTLAPVFTFHLMTAAYAQLAYYKYPALWVRAESELGIISQCLVEMAKRYPSAVGAQRVVKAVFRAVKSQERHEGPLQLFFDKDQKKYFDFLGPELCSKWGFVYEGVQNSSQPFTMTPMAPPQSAEYREPTSDFDQVLHLDAGFDAYSGAQNYPYATVGNWMLGDWMADLGWTASENLPQS